MWTLRDRSDADLWLYMNADAPPSLSEEEFPLAQATRAQEIEYENALIKRVAMLIWRKKEVKILVSRFFEFFWIF